MSRVRPFDLPVLETITPDTAIVADNGELVGRTTPSALVDAALPLASQEDAEKGLDNEKRMSSLRTRQAIEATAGTASYPKMSDGASVQEAIAVAANPAALLASTAQYTVGSTIRTADGFIYEVAPADAADAHVTTAGGVKLYVVSGTSSGLTITPEMFGARGDNTGDSQPAIQAALDYLRLRGGGTLLGMTGATYRLGSGISIVGTGVVFDLGGATLNADWSPSAPEWAVTVGDGATIFQRTGIRNGLVTTAQPSVNLNGVIFRRNVRFQPVHDQVTVSKFKGVGWEFEELNWSIQRGFAPLIDQCGVNLIINENGNAIEIAGAALQYADTYNCIIRGAVGVTFSGGQIQFAGVAGVKLERSSKVDNQQCLGVSFVGTYFEGNGVNHIVGTDGRGLLVTGCPMNCGNMTGSAIKLEKWTGAFIEGNSPANLSQGLQRDFVEAVAAVEGEAGCSLIYVGPQAVTSVLDAQVCVQGGSTAGIINAPHPLATLPTPGVLNRGATLLVSETGTASGRSSPHVCVDTASGERSFRRVGLAPRKMVAALGASPYTPNVGQFETFDLTVPTTGLTINAPVGPYADGDSITFLFKQTSVGGGAVTWDAAYATDLSNEGNAANTHASVTFMWSAGRSRWIQIGKMGWAA